MKERVESVSLDERKEGACACRCSCKTYSHSARASDLNSRQGLLQRKPRIVNLMNGVSVGEGVVVAHGFEARCGDEKGFDLWCQWLVESGFVVRRSTLLVIGRSAGGGIVSVGRSDRYWGSEVVCIRLFRVSIALSRMVLRIVCGGDGSGSGSVEVCLRVVFNVGKVLVSCGVVKTREGKRKHVTRALSRA